MTKLSKIYSAQVSGLKARIVTVEADLFRGFHSFNIVGLPDKAVEESKDRISSAVRSVGFTSPKSKSQKVVISLAPADLKKEGPLFDLPIALAYLLARGRIQFNPEKKLFVGELSLSGELRSIKGTLLLAQKARDAGFEELFLPKENVEEAALIEGIRVYGASNLKDVVSHLNEKELDKKQKEKYAITGEKIPLQEKTQLVYHEPKETVALFDVKGHNHAKRGLQIAAAGGHNIAFFGPPGTGKTLLAKAFTSLLPPLQFNEVLEVTGIHSVAGSSEGDLVTHPPFRAPHHTSSYISIIGGGTYPKPGEVTLAHRGVLFLDEFPEFDRRVIESLRQPLEDGRVNISRARGSELFPAEFILIAALNPCPCGFYGDPQKACACTQSSLLKYRRKISGPIIDRIDMWIEIPRVEYEVLSNKTDEKDILEIKELKEHVIRAREAQNKRFENTPHIHVNSRMGVREIEQYCVLDTETRKSLDNAARNLNLSPRAYHRIIKLARTIADLRGNDAIQNGDILEAVQYRPKSFFV